MENREAIEMLERFQNPEPWEPQITSRAYEALEMAIAALKKQEQEKWIPVTERLPKPGVDVLVTQPPNDWNGKKYKVSPAWICNVEDAAPLGEWALTGRLDFRSVIPIDKALAWRPLPEPYEAEEES